MDRVSLEQMLSRGLSLEEIGQRFGRHESTVGYWVKKHGLEAVNGKRHAARGALARDELERLVESGATIAQIAVAVGRSKTTVRHWLREYRLRTQRGERLDRESETPRGAIQHHCPHHGLTDFGCRSDGGYRCLKCRSDAVVRRRRKIKRTLVEEAGGECVGCGYNRCIAALEFHHVDPTEKSFSLSHRGVARSLTRARVEAEKCVLVCANCHAEVEAGVRRLP
jgi:transposase-like protein